MNDKKNEWIVACKLATNNGDKIVKSDECGLCEGKIIWPLNRRSRAGVLLCEPCYDRFQSIPEDQVKSSLKNLMNINVI